jgi:hypothetical protein
LIEFSQQRYLCFIVLRIKIKDERNYISSNSEHGTINAQEAKNKYRETKIAFSSAATYLR